MTESQKSPDDQDRAVSTNKGTWRSRRVVIPAVAAIAVLAAGSSAWASLVDDNLSGDQPDKASRAAVDAAGGGTVIEVEQDDGFYEVEVTRKDGTEWSVRLGKDYGVLSSHPDD